MQQKDFQSITVTDVVREADINRGTFYAHYRDVYDLRDKIECGRDGAEKRLDLVRCAAEPDGADGVDHVTGGERIALREPALAHGTAAELDALGEELAARGAVDGAVHAAASEKRAVGGIDDGVDIERRDVALDDGDGTRLHGGFPKCSDPWIVVSRLRHSRFRIRKEGKIRTQFGAIVHPLCAIIGRFCRKTCGRS